MNSIEQIDNDSGAFIKRINDLLNEIIKIKKELTSSVSNKETNSSKRRSKLKGKQSKKNLWKDDYDLLYDRITEIKGIAQYNYIMAIEQFRALDISNYDSFSNYIYNKDIDIFKCRKGYIERTKLLRARRKGKHCPECHKALSSSSGVMVCKYCGYSSNTKNGAPDFRTGTDSSKHTCKHIDAITGAKKPPANIVKIIHYISTWLTDLKYIYRWLVDNNKLSIWIQKYKQVTNESITYSFFTKKIERTEEETWDYNVYKLFTDEFYELLEKAKRYSKLKSSNMESLTQEQQKEIITEFIKEKKIKKIPEPNVRFSYKGVDYEIGLFFNTLSLIGLSPSDTEYKNEYQSETIELIYWIWNTFKINAAMPGLMFNFNDIYCQSDNVPKRYNFTQEYAYILHETFHVSYIDISVQDKKAIMNLVLKFNEFYKKHSLNANGKECNAPLFACTLMCILNQFPYFRKYKGAIKLQPIKDKNTSSRIRLEWFKFMNSNPDIMKTYNKEIIEENVIKNEEMKVEDDKDILDVFDKDEDVIKESNDDDNDDNDDVDFDQMVNDLLEEKNEFNLDDDIEANELLSDNEYDGNEMDDCDDNREDNCNDDVIEMYGSELF